MDADEVHHIAFSKPSAGRRGYHEDDVDRFLERIEAALRNPSTRRLTAEQVHAKTFNKPPIGHRGYNEDEVDAFMNRVAAQLAAAGPAPVSDTRTPTRYTLYSLSTFSGSVAALALDVGNGALRVTELSSGELVATAALAEVAVGQAQHGGFPVMILDAPGMQTLTIRAQLIPKEWRRRAKSRKPEYFLPDEDWVDLAEKLGAGPELVDEFVPQTFVDHVLAFGQESRHWTWRTFLVFGLIALAVSFFAEDNALIVAAAGAGLLVVAGLFWRFNWRF